MLDLTSDRVLRRLAVEPSVLTGDRLADPASCRRIAREHVLGGHYGAILAPSAACSGEVNLMIYLESTRGIRLLANGPDRVTLHPGFRLH